jgi:DNA gyrase/topoisomerase IV subunit A
VGERTGLDSVSIAVLAAFERLGATPQGTHHKCASIIEDAYRVDGLAPRYGYDALCTMAAPWLMNVPLVDFHGNLGGPDDTDRPAGPRYTEARLSQAGAAALASEGGELPRLPIGLLNGDLAIGGTVPPFESDRLVAALALANKEVGDEQLIAAVGAPCFPTRCAVDVDVAALAAGEQTRLRLSAQIELANLDGSELVISNLPYGVGPDAVMGAISARVDVAGRREIATHPELHHQLRIPLRDVRDVSENHSSRLVCHLEPGADPAQVRAQLLQIWPISTELATRLGAPLARLIHESADPDATAQHDVLTAILATR